MNTSRLRSPLLLLALAIAFGLLAGLTAQAGIAFASEKAAPLDPAGVITIGDYVWADSNFNGEQDVSEQGINGVEVELYRDDGDGIFDPDKDQLYLVTITSDNGSTMGWYEFETNFLPGDYWVYVPPQPTLNGLVHTSDVTYGPNPLPVTIASGGVGRDDVDFGFAEPIIDVQKTVYLGNDNGASCPGEDSVAGAPGADVVYCFEVTNTSDDSLLGFLTLIDADLGIDGDDVTPAVDPLTPLAAGESNTYAYQTTLNGYLLNTVVASASVVDQNGIPINNIRPTDEDTAEVDQIAPAIDLQKTVYIGHDDGDACDSGLDNVTGEQGALITYCFEVTNSGDTYLGTVEIDDPDLNIDETDMTPIGTLPLAPAESIVYYYETTIQGSLVNEATATATPEDETGEPIPGVTPPTDEDTAEVEEVTPALEIQKSVYLGHNSGASCAAGQEFLAGDQGTLITYCFKVTNTGDTYLDDVQISDPDLAIDESDMTAIGTLPLAPAESIVYYYETTIQGDLVNEATATATPEDETGAPDPGVTPPTDEDTAEVEEVAPALEIQKTVYLDHDGGASCASGLESVMGDQGTSITYCFEVKNTGDTYLNDVQIDDPDLEIDETDMTAIGSLPLAPTESIIYYFETTIQGSLVNEATATATPEDENGAPIPGATPPTDEDTAEVEQVTPGIRIEKSVYLGNDGGAGCPGTDTVAGVPGADITYCFTVTNAGGSRLDDVEIDDVELSITQDNMVVKEGELPLEPNESIVYYYATTISGPLVNTAIVTATPVDEDGNPIPDVEQPTDEDTAEVEEVEPGMEIQKTVYIGHNGGAFCPGIEQVTIVQATDVTYCFLITNTGNTRLDNIVFSDPELGIDKDDLTKIDGSEPLEVGASISYYYQATADGDLTNTATVSATPVDNQEQPLPGIPDPKDGDTATVDQVTPAVEIEKSVYAGHNSGASCPGGELVQGSNGDAVTYCFEVTNSGDSYLDLVNISDPDLGIVQSDLTLVSGSLPLAPAESIVYYYDSTINGDLINTATVETTPTTPDGEPLPNAPKPSDEDTAEVNGLGPGIRIEKTIYPGHNVGAGCPGGETLIGSMDDPITYCFEVVNIGNTYLDNISIVDPLLGITQNNMVRLSGATPLAPGASVVYYYEDTISSALVNTAAVSADPTDDQGTVIPGLESPSDADNADVSLQPTGAIGDFVWNDLNTNGIQDFGEPGIPGATVQLYDSDGNLVAEATTDVNGFYEFTDVDPGQYYIQFTPPSDSYFFTEPYQSNNPTEDSNANPATGNTEFFMVNPGVSDPTIDAGLIQNPTLVLLKTANVAKAEAGDSITYVLSFTNDGPGPALEVIITEIVPQYTTFDATNSTPGWTCADGSPGGTECLFNYGALAVGGNGSVLFSVIVDLKLPDDISSIKNVALINDIPSGEEDDDQVDIPAGPPNAVTLESFTATVVKQSNTNVVQIDWVTSAEIDTLGFHIYRSTQATPESSARLTSSLISGQGSQGGAYSYTDESVVTGIPYFYWLVESEIGGVVNWYGPISALVEGAGTATDVQLFLPLITR